MTDWPEGSRYSSVTKTGCGGSAGCGGAICSAGTAPCHAVLRERCQSARTPLGCPHGSRGLSAATDVIFSPGEKGEGADASGAFPGSVREPCGVELRALGLWGAAWGGAGALVGGSSPAHPQLGKVGALRGPSGNRNTGASQQGHSSCRAGAVLGSLVPGSVPLCLLVNERICQQGADESHGAASSPASQHLLPGGRPPDSARPPQASESRLAPSS